mmetsp:Transcript_125794/g.317100  ORF Transcript_125794/g.317100 Transcript_125794/m.317100 type:complete len:241 (+) Transcript_125794:936-1658(+)
MQLQGAAGQLLRRGGGRRCCARRGVPRQAAAAAAAIGVPVPASEERAHRVRQGVQVGAPRREHPTAAADELADELRRGYVQTRAIRLLEATASALPAALAFKSQRAAVFFAIVWVLKGDRERRLRRELALHDQRLQGAQRWHHWRHRPPAAVRRSVAAAGWWLPRGGRHCGDHGVVAAVATGASLPGSDSSTGQRRRLRGQRRPEFPRGLRRGFGRRTRELWCLRPRLRAALRRAAGCHC